MYLADYHVHSRISPDASYPMARLAEAARAAGLDELCFTDHVEPILIYTTDPAVTLEQAAEPTGLLKADLIQKQGELIALLYDEQTADESAKALKAGIDADLARLAGRPLSRLESSLRNR